MVGEYHISMDLIQTNIPDVKIVVPPSIVMIEFF